MEPIIALVLLTVGLAFTPVEIRNNLFCGNDITAVHTATSKDQNYDPESTQTESKPTFGLTSL